MSSTKTWFVYLIECSDGSLYTGITVDLESRFAAHRDGRGARCMRMHAPLRMLAAEAHPRPLGGLQGRVSHQAADGCR